MELKTGTWAQLLEHQTMASKAEVAGSMQLLLIYFKWTLFLTHIALDGPLSLWSPYKRELCESRSRRLHGGRDRNSWKQVQVDGPSLRMFSFQHALSHARSQLLQFKERRLGDAIESQQKYILKHMRFLHGGICSLLNIYPKYTSSIEVLSLSGNYKFTRKITIH